MAVYACPNALDRGQHGRLCPHSKAISRGDIACDTLLSWQLLLVGIDFFEVLSETTVDEFPDKEDLNGAADALIRLQDLYHLTTDQVASGQLHSDILDPVPMKRKRSRFWQHCVHVLIRETWKGTASDERNFMAASLIDFTKSKCSETLYYQSI